MTETKNPLASKTNWGALLMLVALVAEKFGFIVTPEDQATLIQVGFSLSEEITGAVGFLLVLWGRWTAKKPITLTGKTLFSPLLLCLVVGLGGCSSGAPQASERNLIATAGVDHLERIEADVDLPEDQKQTWRDRWRTFTELSQGTP